MIQEEPLPIPQRGEVILFERRKPAQSKIGDPGSLQNLYDFIRMLDADGYPRAFIEYNGFRFEFDRANLYDGQITANVKIFQKDFEPKKSSDCNQVSNPNVA